MLLLQYVKKDMHEVRFVKYPTKYQNENKIIHIGRGQIILFVSGKKGLETNFELSIVSDHGWDENANIWWIEESFPKI